MNSSSNWYQDRNRRIFENFRRNQENIAKGLLNSEANIPADWRNAIQLDSITTSGVPPTVPGASLTGETNRQKIASSIGVDPLQLNPELDEANIFLVTSRRSAVNFPDSVRLKALVIIVVAFCILIILRTESGRLLINLLIIVSIVIVAAAIYWNKNPENSSFVSSMFILILILYTFLSNGLNVSRAFEIFVSLGIWLLLITLLYSTRFWLLLTPLFLISAWIALLLFFPDSTETVLRDF
jgi:hypothetical protein